MFAHLAKVTVKPGMLDEFVEFLRWDADVARTDEPGTLRFDVYPVADDPNSIYLYEAYESEAAFASHCGAKPFKKFVDHFVPNVITNIEFLVQSGSPLAVNRAL